MIAASAIPTHEAAIHPTHIRYISLRQNASSFVRRFSFSITFTTSNTMTYIVIDTVQSILDNNADKLQVGFAYRPSWKNSKENVWINL